MTVYILLSNSNGATVFCKWSAGKGKILAKGMYGGKVAWWIVGFLLLDIFTKQWLKHYQSHRLDPFVSIGFKG